MAYKYPTQSPYSAFANNPIVYDDNDGREITYKITYDKNNRPIITITISGKVIDYADKWITSAEGVARRMNDIDWLEYDGVDLTGLEFKDDNGEVVTFSNNEDGSPITGTVKFEFNLEAAESIVDASEEDHILAISPFTKEKHMSNGVIKSKQKATGVVNRRGGKVAFIDGDIYQGVLDYSSGYGEVVTAHEFITHALGISHKGGKSSLTTGGGINFYSTKLEIGQIRSILRNVIGNSIWAVGRGNNKGVGGPILVEGQQPLPLYIPNTVYTNDNGQKGNVSEAGVEVEKIKKKERKIQKKRILDSKNKVSPGKE